MTVFLNCLLPDYTLHEDRDCVYTVFWCHTLFSNQSGTQDKYIFNYVYANIHTHIHTHPDVGISKYVGIDIYVYIYEYIYVYAYIHTYSYCLDCPIKGDNNVTNTWSILKDFYAMSFSDLQFRIIMQKGEWMKTHLTCFAINPLPPFSRNNSLFSFPPCAPTLCIPSFSPKLSYTVRNWRQ